MGYHKLHTFYTMFWSVVQSCKQLRQQSISGQLTVRVFLYIGKYAEKLEMFSIAFAGKNDKGMLNVLNGCKKLHKLMLEYIQKDQKCITIYMLQLAAS
ncbi:hypothetical protein TSUD_250240 [Trifolium subterraneum]|nr:hypothetical protein TSUD_250240 [Trifolium subterraneum]